MVDRWIRRAAKEQSSPLPFCPRSSLQPSHSLCRDMATALLMASQAKDTDLPKVVAVGQVD
jgi:hypothetical protein